MKIWLSMIIKNEEKNLKKNFSNFFHLFDDIVVIDTWSNDWSISLLKKLGIKKIIQYSVIHSDKRLIDARNLSIQENSCEWVLVMDADEFINCEDIQTIKEIIPKPWIYWYFIKWLDHRYDKDFEDYKMCIIRKEVQFLFNVHACPQVYLRDKKLAWERIDNITLHHYPIKRSYRNNYITQLENWIKEFPDCVRFYWFLWYTHYKNNNFLSAKYLLNKSISFHSRRSPVETLNSYMILCSINYWENNQFETINLLIKALQFYEEVKDDFEIKINFRLYEWFKNTFKTAIFNKKIKLKPYEFWF